MNTEEFEKLVEKLRETLVDEPTTDTGRRSDYIVRASEGRCETFINILDALPGTLLRIGEVYYFRLYERRSSRSSQLARGIIHFLLPLSFEGSFTTT